MDSNVFKDFQDYQKWVQRSDTKAKEAMAQTNVWLAFTKQFPNADKNQFVSQIKIDEQHKITAENFWPFFEKYLIFFKEGPGSLQSVFGSNRHSWSQKMKSPLGLAEVEGFPYQLSPMKPKKALAIPAVNFAERPARLKQIFNQPINIYVTQETFFVTKFREIFQPNTTWQPNQSSGWAALTCNIGHRRSTLLCLCDTGLRNFMRNL